MRSVRTVLLSIAALGLSLAQPALAAPMITASPAASAVQDDGNARLIPLPNSDPVPAPLPGFIPLDPSLQPPTDTTQVQIPDPASNQEVAGEYGVGLVLLIVAGLLTTAVLIGVFMIVMRQTWDATPAPASQRRPSE